MNSLDVLALREECTSFSNNLVLDPENWMTIPITDLSYFLFVAIWDDPEMLHFAVHGLRIDNTRSQLQHVFLTWSSATCFLGTKISSCFLGASTAIIPIPWNVPFPSIVRILWSTLSPVNNTDTYIMYIVLLSIFTCQLNAREWPKNEIKFDYSSIS